MSRQSIVGFCGACVLGSAVLVGCQDPPHQAVSHVPPPPPRPVLQTQAYPTAPSPPVQTWVSSRPVTLAEQPPTDPQAMPRSDRFLVPVPAGQDAPVPAGQNAPVPAGQNAPVGGGEESSLAQAQSATVKAPSHRGEEAPQRKSFTDISAHSSFGHAPDYSWLSGEVQYSRISKGWRLRYASVDEDDPYGGSVTLVEQPLPRGLKDGQFVRVQGHLDSPGAKGISPPYQIDSVQPIEASASPAAPAQ